MNPTQNEMGEKVLKRFAKRLLRCPFDEELFDSIESLSEYLLKFHSAGICRRQRLPKQEALGDIDRPSKLTFCGHCLGNMVPDAPGRNTLSEIIRHIRQEHPNPNGSAIITMKSTVDTALIDQFVDEQVSPEVCVCTEPECGEWFSSEANVAKHWVEKHSSPPMIEDVRTLLETDSDRFEKVLEECFKEVAEEERRLFRQNLGPDDGYPISHYPSVPRVRSRPSECIVYIDGEMARLREDDFEELAAAENANSDDEVQTDQPWTRQTVSLELRFCNIQDGYVPLVKELKPILPPLSDEGTVEVEVSWQDAPTVFFPCTVSKRKRAIYNPDGELKRAFDGLPSGVVLYITRVARTQYEFRLKAKLHVVRDCKVFVPVGENRWRAESRDLELEWETGGAVFRHQSTFEEMDALHEEARRTNLSVRDAVYEVMREMAQNEDVHIEKVYEVVFWRMRTCSRAAVWSQFRIGHDCYVRQSRSGFYRFDASKPLPALRVLRTATLETRQPTARIVGTDRAPNTRIRIKVRWSVILKQPCPDQEIYCHDSGTTQALFLGSIFSVFGLCHPVSQRLMILPMNRGHQLSLNKLNRELYPKQVPGTELYLLTHSSTDEKKTTILRVAQSLGFPNHSIEVTTSQVRTLADIYRDL